MRMQLEETAKAAMQANSWTQQIQLKARVRGVQMVGGALLMMVSAPRVSLGNQKKHQQHRALQLRIVRIAMSPGNFHRLLVPHLALNVQKDGFKTKQMGT